MLNTAWEDDGEALQGYKWHGYAWGAECAWNGATTTPEDFNRRIGAVLFGEPGDHFGQAIELLAQLHRLPGMQGMNNRRFWEDDFLPRRSVTATSSCVAATAGNCAAGDRTPGGLQEGCDCEWTICWTHSCTAPDAWN